MCSDVPDGQLMPVTLTLLVSLQHRILSYVSPRLIQAWVQQRREFGRLEDYVLQEGEVDGLMSDLFAAERRRVVGHNL